MSRVKRVLMTADAVGGVWTYALDLCRCLARRGIEVALATMGPSPSDEQKRQALSIPGVRVFVSDFKLEWQHEPWSDVNLAGAWLLALERDFQPDVVHLNGYSHGDLNWKTPILMVCHSCVFSWWHAVKNQEPPETWDRYRDKVWRGLQAAHRVVAPTWSMLLAVRDLYGPFVEDEVIPNGRDGRLYQPAIKEELILAVGRWWDEGKNLASLAEVAPSLEWPVAVAGDGIGVDPCIQSLGKLSAEDLAEYYGRASIYVHPAKYEPFGLSVLEAAMSGCALVLGDIPSLRENWSGAALFVPPDEPASLRVAIQSLIDNPHTCVELGEKARAQARSFSMEETCDRYLRAYTRLLQTRTGRLIRTSA